MTMTPEERTKRIAEDVGMCYGVRSDKNAITILCDMLYHITLRSKWHHDAVVAIQGVCPEYFEKPKEKEPEVCDKHKCGQCGYFMRYVKHDGTPDHDGDCASIGMNKECYEGKNPFTSECTPILQVDEREDACGFFRSTRTKRVLAYIKEHKRYYVQD
jgi:hypothetical protein